MKFVISKKPIGGFRSFIYSKSNTFKVSLLIIISFIFFSVFPYLAGSGLALSDVKSIDPYANNVFPADPNFGDPYRIAFPNLFFEAPIKLNTVPNQNTLVVAQLDGRIFSFLNDETTTIKNEIIDISDEVGLVSDGGFLGLAIHPQFNAPTNPKNYFYAYYCTKNSQNQNSPFFGQYTSQQCTWGLDNDPYQGNFVILERFEVNPTTMIANENSRTILIKNRMYGTTHYGGGLDFGDDGFLYLSTGDMASWQTSQDFTNNLNGGALRLDVDKDPGKSREANRKMPGDVGFPDEISGEEYWIPLDNPFLSQSGANFEEYYAVGLRNPFKMTKDSATGLFYIGDVGLSSSEEVNILESGANYGWPEYEGFANKGFCSGMLNGMPHEEPLLAFPRPEVNSITGGYVYRGSAIPELQGKYICADYGSGEELFAVDINTGDYEQIGTFLPRDAIGFGEDYDKELFILRLGSIELFDPVNFQVEFGPTNLYKLKSNELDYTSVPQTLSETGVFTDLSTLEVVDGFIPYELYEPFWSDGAHKRRWMAIPNDGDYNTPSERINYSENGDWEFPSGTVFIKHFDLPIDDNNPNITRKTETRFSIVDNNGEMYFLTYNWNEAQTEATLQTFSLVESVDITTTSGGTRTQDWYFPSNSDCITCHNPASKGSLGLRSRYLNTDYTYPESGLTGNQLVTMSHIGIIEDQILDSNAANILSNKALDDTSATLDEKARSYLDLNCAYCHRADNNNRAEFDLRLINSIQETGLLTAGILSPLGVAADEEILFQGDASKSILWHRMASTDPNIMMPPLAKSIIDQPAVDLIEDWINGLQVCLIKDIIAGAQSNCDELTNTFTQELIISYINEPTTGTLDINGQSFAITGSPQTVILTNLDANGTSIDLTANFSDDPECSFTINDFVTAPTGCSQTGLPDNVPDDMINLGLISEAVLDGSVTSGRGNLTDILYNPSTGNYFESTAFNEYGVAFQQNIGQPTAEEGFYWRVNWPNPKYINYITFGGTYVNQPQPNSMWRISYFKDGTWVMLDEGQGGWINSGIFEWGGADQIPIIAESLRVQVFSDGSNDVISIHLRGRGGISTSAGDDTATTPKATLIQYVPLDSSCGLTMSGNASLFCNESWTDGEPDETTDTKNVYIGNGIYVVQEDETIEVNHLEVSVGAKLVIEQGASIKINGNLTNNGVIDLLSTSTKFSSLIVEGTSSGTINYKRHINAFSSNDLISPPVKGNNFANFAIMNPNIFENPSNTDQKLFGPFNEGTGEYEIYSLSSHSSQIIEPGIGYRTARDSSEDGISGTSFTFVGNIETQNVNIPITTSGSSFDGWNLIGNPFSSYISFQDFFLLNQSELEGSSFQAIYGYNGSGSGNRWEILNALTTERLIAPGQGFFVKSKSGGGTISFTTSMRRTGDSDDFILGRNAQSPHYGYLRLEADAQDMTFNTEFYFNSNASIGLDPGYDASLFGGTAPPYSIYSLLVENDNGMPYAIQALGADDMNDITIPLGLNANEGQNITIAIAQTDLPSSVNVYIEDAYYNTSTLINNDGYSFTALENLSGHGRFYLKFESSALSIEEAAFEELSIISTKEKTVDITGNLLEKTECNIYDMHGRLILNEDLDVGTNLNSIDVVNLNMGIYIVELRNVSGEKRIKKVVIR